MESEVTSWKEYDFDSKLGAGAYGVVYLTHRPGQFCVGKVINKKKARGEIKYIQREIEVLKKVSNSSNPNLLKLIEYGDDETNYYIITEYYNGGDVAALLQKRIKEEKRAFSEEEVQYIMRNVLNGLDYLHKNNILHRDLKLNNLMINYDSDEDRHNQNIFRSNIVIVDFGFSRVLEPGKYAESNLGTQYYMGPEMLKKICSNLYNKKFRDAVDGKYDAKLDIWSLGILCYEMIVGVRAFSGRNIEALVEKITKGIYYLPTNIYQETYDFITSMLHEKPDERPGTDLLLKHPFIINDVSSFHKLNLSGKKIESGAVVVGTK